jgi:hypothetical protein
VPVTWTGPTRVRDVGYRGREGLGTLDIALTDDRVRVTEGVSTQTYAELIIDGAELPASLERNKADLTMHGSPLRHITIVRDPRDASRFFIRVALLAPATASIRRSPGVVRWHFQGNDMP